MTLEEAMKVVLENQDRVCFWGEDSKIYILKDCVFVRESDSIIVKIRPQ
jgi:hypothetical protein